MARTFPYNLRSILFLWIALGYSEAALTWPTGTYGLPRAKVGCPVTVNSTVWATGWRFEDTEDHKPFTSKSPSFHLDTEVGIDVNRTFCIKTKDIISEEAGEWPQGRYCIYKKGDCPRGLKEGYVFWDDENYKNINDQGGTLPDGKYDKDTSIYYCCSTDGDKFKPIPLPLISPFYLMAFNTSECQRVQGAIATEEYIAFDSEDNNNQNACNGSYPFGPGGRNHRVYYCYYEGCLYTYSLDSDEQILFISPKFFNDGFPSEQKCTWRFVAREKESKVHITFLETHIREGDSISIRNGWSSGSVVGKIDPKNPFDPNGYASQNNFLLVEFNSKSSLTPGIHHPKGFRGIFKIISNEVPQGPKWPNGTYGLPRPRAGCPPRSDDIFWETGWRFQDTEDNKPSNKVSESFHMDATVDKDGLNKSFCIATQDKGTEWPKGQYCIYKKGACPKGLSEGYILFDDEDHKNQNKMGGTLPDGIYNKDTNISYCCRTDGDKLEPVTLPVSNPFYLLAYNTSECQQVNGAIATKEFIHYFTEDGDHNRDQMNGAYPYVKGKNLTITYCYYQACHYTMSETPQEFMSPFYRSGDGYPNSQLCTWRFLVQEKNPKSQQILIKFPEFNLRKDGDGDVVRIYGGWDEKAKLLAEFNGDHPPPTKGVAADSSVVYVVFKSDSQARSKGFRGVFLNQTYNAASVPTRPITIPTRPIPVKTNETSVKEKTNETTTVTTASASLNLTTTKSEGSQSARSGKHGVPTAIIVLVVIAILIGMAVSIYCIRRKRLRQRIKRMTNSGLLAQGKDREGYHYSDLEEYEFTGETPDLFPPS